MCAWESDSNPPSCFTAVFFVCVLNFDFDYEQQPSGRNESYGSSVRFGFIGEVKQSGGGTATLDVEVADAVTVPSTSQSRSSLLPKSFVFQ